MDEEPWFVTERAYLRLETIFRDWECGSVKGCTLGDLHEGVSGLAYPSLRRVVQKLVINCMGCSEQESFDLPKEIDNNWGYRLGNIVEFRLCKTCESACHERLFAKNIIKSDLVVREEE